VLKTLATGQGTTITLTFAADPGRGTFLGNP
jgi:hypothetical protein